VVCCLLLETPYEIQKIFPFKVTVEQYVRNLVQVVIDYVIVLRRLNLFSNLH